MSVTQKEIDLFEVAMLLAHLRICLTTQMLEKRSGCLGQVRHKNRLVVKWKEALYISYSSEHENHYAESQLSPCHSIEQKL